MEFTSHDLTSGVLRQTSCAPHVRPPHASAPGTPPPKLWHPGGEEENPLGRPEEFKSLCMCPRVDTAFLAI